jgi:hypothetical protein
LTQTYAVVDLKPVAGQGDDALDVALFRVARIMEDHHVAALDGRDVIDELVDEEPVRSSSRGNMLVPSTRTGW